MSSVVAMAIVKALGLGALAGVSETAKKVVSNYLIALKGKIEEKKGADNKLSQAIGFLESDPETKELAQLIQKRSEELQIDSDPELKQLAQQILEELKKDPVGAKSVNSVVGDNSAAGNTGDNSTGHNSHNTTNYHTQEVSKAKSNNNQVFIKNSNTTVNK